ncbi:MAG: glycoside hydrolase family 88 protein, partial [Pontiellaceae bacterium]|nr:glycoside hydrolase family 88 protein [Pontiellaceae bacterium]
MRFKALLGLTVLGLAMGGVAAEPARTPADVQSVMKKVADWQIEHLRDDINREHASDNRLTAWTFGALYVGMEKWAAMSGDETYYDFLKGIAEENKWDLGPGRYHADDQIVGQLYLQLYRKYGDEKMKEKVQRRTEWIRDNPSKQPINLNHYANTERWTWCDALFMAPPVWAKLSNITGDDSFRNWMFKEYKATYDHLYDPEEHLFFRDEHFIDRRDFDRKVFWSRGNGWVFGGLTLIIQELPEGEQRDWFVALFKDMAPALAKLQTEEGHWAMSLLAADKYPTPETSGTAFFTYGLAWGINHGLLDREEYLPIVMKGWDSLVSHVTDEGLLGYVQPVGAAPGDAWPDRSEVYGVGAFLAAGSEVVKLVGPENLTFMKDGGYCWYQDPRAVIADHKLVIGGIDGQKGDVKISVYDLVESKDLGTVVLHAGFEADDHDAPALYVRPDGRILAMYSKHANDHFHYYRISEPNNYLKW